MKTTVSVYLLTKGGEDGLHDIFWTYEVAEKERKKLENSNSYNIEEREVNGRIELNHYLPQYVISIITDVLRAREEVFVERIAFAVKDIEGGDTSILNRAKRKYRKSCRELIEYLNGEVLNKRVKLK